MEKKLSEYLHYYIGQDCMTWDVDIFEKEGVDKITGISGMGGYVILSNSQISSRRIKPILRSLSSMTEGEAEHYIDFPDGYEIVETPIKYSGGWVFQYRFVHQNHKLNLEDGFHYSERSFSFKQKEFTPSQFHYLLSLGMDLFGLIEAGIALDKEKEK